jgi:hypothetical protein
VGATADSAFEDCLGAARKVLGPTAQVAKCGALLGGPSLQTVAFAKLKQFDENQNGIPVSRLVILRKVDSQWSVALDVDKQIQNPSGYVGIDYIDDSQVYPGFRVLLSDRRSDGKTALDLQLYYLGLDGKTEGVPVEISWNPVAGRFQEFSVNSEPEGFRAELKNPPHIHTAKPVH